MRNKTVTSLIVAGVTGLALSACGGTPDYVSELPGCEVAYEDYAATTTVDEMNTFLHINTEDYSMEEINDICWGLVITNRAVIY